MSTCSLDPAHPAEEPFSDALGHVPRRRRGASVDSLRRCTSLAEGLQHVVGRKEATLQDGRGPADFVEEVAVAPSRLPDPPGAGRLPGAPVAPPKGAAVARLERLERGLEEGGLPEAGPEAVRMGRDGHPSEGDDPLDGLRDGEVPRDRLPDAVPEDMA